MKLMIRTKIFLFLCILILALTSCTNSVKDNDHDTITLGFVGDVMLDRGVGQMIKANNNTKIPFLKVRDELRSVDVLFGNLESPISDINASCSKNICFQADAYTVDALEDAGFDVLSLANNHALDYGSEVLLNTRNILSEKEMQGVGIVLANSTEQELVVEYIKGVSIGFLAYDRWDYMDENVSTGNIGDNMYAEIMKADDKVDILVISLHWGREYETEQDEDQMRIAHAVIENGADIVIGHHPHVLQGFEEYEGGIIAYSLGNFLFDQPTEHTPVKEGVNQGVLLLVDVVNATVHNYELVHTQQNDYYQVRWKNEYSR